MAARNVQLKVETPQQNSFLTPEDYQDIFWNFFHISKTAIAFTDRIGNLLFCNAEFKRRLFTGIAVRDLSLFVHDTAGTKLNEDVWEITVSVQPVIKLCRMQLRNHPGGAAFLWFSDAEAPVDQNRHIAEVKNLYTSFIDNSFEMVCHTDDADRVLFFNKNFIRSFEFNSSLQIHDFFFHGLVQDRVTFGELKGQVVREGSVVNQRIYFTTLCGRVLVGLVNCHVQYHGSGGNVFHWTILDISDRVQFEESLQQKNEQLAKLNAQMEKFLYSTSHDLRSPLTSIFGLVNLLRLELSDKNILEYVSRIESSTLKLDKIIRDIMSFSKTTYQHVNTDCIDLEKLFWRVINNYQGDSNFKKIEFEVKALSNTEFFSDGDRLEIILDSLIRNCVHFMDANKVRSFVHVNIAIDSGYASIEIIDNGIGIAQSHLDQIFNMFYKASLQSRGAGLGLYIVKEGIEQLNGSISVESEAGFGSIFRITLPNEQKQ
jgi:signal transduction histidine kinase